jgi:antibiotic biosynthesis monooxygenase (ABM) superfamily enzyme
MVSRVWHCYTTPEDADAFEKLLKTEIFVGIQNRQIAGYKGVQLFRRTLGVEIEFLTVMWFDSFDSVRSFAGENYEAAIVPEKVRALLTRFDAGSQHYEVTIDLIS